MEGVELILDNKKIINKHYHPTRDTVEGRSQCFELMVQYKINVGFQDGDIFAYPEHVDFDLMAYENVQRAICEAVILSNQHMEKNND